MDESDGDRPRDRRDAATYAVVVFDLDGTLLRGTTVSRLVAQWLGKEEEIADLERAFQAREVSNSVVADTTARWLAGRRIDEAWSVVGEGRWIDGMAETFRTLSAGGASLLLGTITWSFIAAMVSERAGFVAFSGTEMHATDGVLSGVVSRYFDEHDKVRFVEEWCVQNGYSMSQVAAIGDSRSDVPLFRRVGMSIALNATPDAQTVATSVLDTEDLRDVLPLLRPPPKWCE